MTTEEKMLVVAYRLDAISDEYEQKGGHFVVTGLALAQVAKAIRAAFHDTTDNHPKATE